MADNLLDKASILLTPTAYNDGSMLSIKPENGDGDFTFSRGSAATRVNAQGLVENVQIISEELVSNGDFSQIDTEEVSNGNFSQEGSELITNGDFSNGSANWTISGGNSEISNGKLNLSNATTYGTSISNSATVVSGKTYLVEYTISDYVSGSSQIRLGSQFGTSRNSNGTFSEYIVANSTLIRLYPSSDNTTLSIDNVSVKEVGQNWTLGTGWSIGDDVAVREGLNSYSNIKQDGILTIGKTYKVTYTINQGAVNGVRVNIGGVYYGDYYGVGTHTIYGQAANNADLFLMAEPLFQGSITNISVKEVGQDWTLGTGWSIGDDEAVATSGASTKLTQSISGLSGKYCKVSLTLSDYGGNGSVRVDFGSVSSDPINTNGEHTIYGTYDNNAFELFKNTGFSGSITNISIKEITDDTDIPRINYSGFSYQDVLGSELVVNGDFSIDSGWNGQKTIANGQLTKDSSGLVYKGILDVSVKDYKVVVDVDTAGSALTIYLGGAQQSLSEGVNTFDMQSGSSNNFVGFNNGDGSVINSISVKEVTGQEVVPDSGCGSWLLEGQSTNLVTESNLLGSISGGVVTLNAAISPDGKANAIEVDFGTATNSGGLIYATGSSATPSTEYTISWYAKNSLGDGTYKLRLDTDTQSSLVNETFVATSEWARYTHTFTTDASASSFSSGTRFRKSSTTDNNKILLYGIQLEEQSYATSYIPTNGSIATRLADVANNSGNATLINSTEGVLYAEMAALAENEGNRCITISANSSNKVMLRFTTLNRVQVFVVSNGVLVSNELHTLTNITDFNKFAFKYKSGDNRLFVNGLKVDDNNDTFSFTSDLNKVNFNEDGGQNFYGKAKAIAVYKEALTDEQLQSLTTI